MAFKVYILDEVAAILRISVADVVLAIMTGEVDAFQVAGHWRITEESLLKVMDRTSSQITTIEDEDRGLDSMDEPKKRNRDPEQVRQAKQWIAQKLRRVAPDVTPYPPSKEFIANGKAGILSIAAVESKNKAGLYWFGFPKKSLDTGRPTFIVAVVAPRQRPEPTAFVIPYSAHKTAVDGWAIDHNGQKKYHILEESSQFYLMGKGIDRIDITRYQNTFDLLQ
ncbi:MAG: helix-turn-helix domain-containing protein [Chloroflexota bacterium]